MSHINFGELDDKAAGLLTTCCKSPVKMAPLFHLERLCRQR